MATLRENIADVQHRLDNLEQQVFDHIPFEGQGACLDGTKAATWILDRVAEELDAVLVPVGDD
jgi:hypothetical protein